MRIVVALVLAYLIGSIPSGLFWGWALRRMDVRQHGSGRTGGTNVWRTVGFGPALITAICDALKGASAIWVAKQLGTDMWVQAIAGTLAIVGHNYSLYLRFKGGAGTMPSIGGAGALWGTSFWVLLLSGIATMLLVGHASVASLLIALLLPVIFAWRGEWAYAIGFGLPTFALTVWALRPNIERLRQCRERFLPLYAHKPPPIQLCKRTGKSSEKVKNEA